MTMMLKVRLHLVRRPVQRRGAAVHGAAGRHQAARGQVPQRPQVGRVQQRHWSDFKNSATIYLFIFYSIKF